MKKYFVYIFLNLLCMLINANEIQLAKDNKTSHVIIYTSIEKEAANELKLHLEEITGANFKLIEETENLKIKSPAIYVGDTNFANKHGVKSSDYDLEEWVIKTIDDNIILSGGITRGTLYSVYDLLEEQFNCRWFAWDTIVVPKNPNLTLKQINKKQKPDFKSRELFDNYYRAFFRGKERYKKEQIHRKRVRSSLDYDTRFAVWPKTSKLYPDGHNFYNFLSPKKYFKTNPEYFSMNKQGKRFHGTIGKTMQGGNFCMTNPDVENIVYKKLISFIKQDRKNLPQNQWPTIYDISPMDSSPFLCLCPECQKITTRENGDNGDSGLLIDFLNRLAKRLEKDYPELYLRSTAYSSTKSAPKFIRPSKKIILQWCNLYAFNDCYRPITHPINKSQKKQFDKWVKTGATIGAREYWNMGGIFFNPPTVETMVDAIAPNLRYFKKSNVAVYFTEMQSDFDNNVQNFVDLQLYLGFKLMVDVDYNEEYLINDFVNGYYGPASEPIGKFLKILRDAIKNEKHKMVSGNHIRPYCTEKFMKEVWGYLEEAYNLTKPNTLYRRHVENEMVTPLYVMLSNTSWQVKERKKMLELYNSIRSKNIEEAYGNDAVGLRLKKDMYNRLETDKLAFAKINLPIPKGFENKKIIMFGWPNLTWASGRDAASIVEDSDSITKRALISPKKNSRGVDITQLHSLSQTIHRSFTPLDFGAYNQVVKNSLHWKYNKRIPKDEKYHWYKIGKYDVGLGSFVWGFYWNTRCDISSVYNPADGIEGYNIYDIYVSIKITGPAYVKGSKKSNEVFWDQVMLVKDK